MWLKSEPNKHHIQNQLLFQLSKLSNKMQRKKNKNKNKNWHKSYVRICHGSVKVKGGVRKPGSNLEARIHSDLKEYCQDCSEPNLSMDFKGLSRIRPTFSPFVSRTLPNGILKAVFLAYHHHSTGGRKKGYVHHATCREDVGSSYLFSHVPLYKSAGFQWSHHKVGLHSSPLQYTWSWPTHSSVMM